MHETRRHNAPKRPIPNTDSPTIYLYYSIIYLFIPFNGRIMLTPSLTRVTRVPTAWLKCQQSCIHGRERENDGDLLCVVTSRTNEETNRNYKKIAKHLRDIESTLISSNECDNKRHASITAWLIRIDCPINLALVISSMLESHWARFNQSHICSGLSGICRRLECNPNWGDTFEKKKRSGSFQR